MITNVSEMFIIITLLLLVFFVFLIVFYRVTIPRIATNGESALQGAFDASHYLDLHNGHNLWQSLNGAE